MSRNNRLLILKVFLGVLILSVFQSNHFLHPATKVKHPPEEVKVILLARITRYIEWPEVSSLRNVTQPFILTVYGKNPFGEWLTNTYPRKKIKERKVQLRFISEISKISDTHILLISDVSRKELEKIIEYTHNKPILTISDSTDYAKRGVLLNFFEDGSKVKLEINETASRQSGLRLDSSLLNHARIIDPYDEYEEKATLLKNIANDVMWPWLNDKTKEPDTFNIGILGDNPFGNILSEVYKRNKILDKKVQINFYQSFMNIEEVQLLFISNSSEERLSDVIHFLRRKPILTVADTSGYAAAGVHINIFTQGLKLQLEVNLNAIQEAGLALKGDLARNSRKVKTQTR